MKNHSNTGNNSLIPWLYFIFLSVTWGSSFILIKRGLEGFTIWQAASMRLIAAAVVLLSFAVSRIRKIPKKKIKYVFLSSILSMFAPSYLFCAAQANINSSMAGILNALTPAFACVAGYFLFKKSIEKFQVVGLIVGFLSTAVLISVQSNSSISINSYAFLVVLAAASYGVNINIVKNYLSDIHPIHLTTVAVSFSGILAAVTLLLIAPKTFVTLNENQLPAFLAVLLLGVGGTAVAQIVLNKLIKMTSVVFASSNTYVIPAVAVLWGIIDGEKLAFWHVLGIAGIILGILILNGKVNLRLRKKKVTTCDVKTCG